ncbi:unnamed protein product [Adineta ricciae]|uniref:Tetratricopeptide repeat protein n=1 Tax=Adineta ricciae TaxID=249248 RepID=A0A815DXI6_ADIRI|nr:unnamed protein product [Adineta ricciae]CAF1570582.1 unnamed protein product [Adineta ricciae]
MLNKALRTNDIKPLFFLHNYIRHLHEQLSVLHQKSIDNERIILYRGQQMPTADFENIKINLGGLLSISRFLSTTTLLDIAEVFAGHSIDDPTISCALFEIYIDPINHNACPFADIAQYSYFDDAEKEYLFSMGAVFRIEKVHLTLADDNDIQLAELKEDIKSNILDENPTLMLGGLLIRMGEYEKAKFFYQIRLTMENAPLRLATVWNQLGIIYNNLGNIEESQKCYDNVLEIKEKHFGKDDPELAITYNNIGTLYQEKGNHHVALAYFQHALSIHLMNPTTNQKYIATDYSNIAAIYVDQGKLEEAFLYYQRALDINLKNLPANHPNLSHSYYFLAMSSYGLGRYDEMIDYMNKTLPPEHPDKIFHETNSFKLMSFDFISCTFS